jgi:hypothetical protein
LRYCTPPRRCSKDFVAWIKKHKQEVFDLYKRECPTTRSAEGTNTDIALLTMGGRQPIENPSRSIIHDEEGGKPSVMLLIEPSMFRQWYRYDDTIDGFEEKPYQSRVKLLGGAGIYPYGSGWTRMRKPAKSFIKEGEGLEIPKDCDNLGPYLIGPAAYAHLVGTWDPKLPPLAEPDLLEHLKKDFRPMLPYGIVALVLWAECFKDPAAFLDELRPMLYVWWC